MTLTREMKKLPEIRIKRNSHIIIHLEIETSIHGNQHITFFLHSHQTAKLIFQPELVTFAPLLLLLLLLLFISVK